MHYHAGVQIIQTTAMHGITGTVVFMVLSTIPILFTLYCSWSWQCVSSNDILLEKTVSQRTFMSLSQLAKYSIHVDRSFVQLCFSYLPDTVLLLSHCSSQSLIDMSLFIAPILIVILFKPVWHKLRQLFCSCCSKGSLGTTAATQDTTAYVCRCLHATLYTVKPV